MTSDPRHEQLTRLLPAFLDGRSPHTVDAYTRDPDDFCAFLGRHWLPPDPLHRVGGGTFGNPFERVFAPLTELLLR